MTYEKLVDLASAPGCQLVSSDIFDTIMFRDSSTETERLAEAGRLAAGQLGLDPLTVVRLRWSMQTSAYQAVALERPAGDASLDRVCAVMTDVLGLPPSQAETLRRAEVDTDIRHLRPNRRLLDVLRQIRTAGRRVVAVSDTYYSGTDLHRMLEEVLGLDPFDAVYSSADLGATKHSGSIFEVVATAEHVPPESVVHIGDDRTADLTRARAAAWTPLHVERDRRHHAARRLRRLRIVPLALRRAS